MDLLLRKPKREDIGTCDNTAMYNMEDSGTCDNTSEMSDNTMEA